MTTTKAEIMNETLKDKEYVQAQSTSPLADFFIDRMAMEKIKFLMSIGEID